MRLVLSLVGGAISGVGLHVSGLIDTAKVQRFLHGFAAWTATRRRAVPLFGGSSPTRPHPRIDRRLAQGALSRPVLASASPGGWQGVAFRVAVGAGKNAAPPAPTFLNRRRPA